MRYGNAAPCSAAPTCRTGTHRAAPANGNIRRVDPSDPESPLALLRVADVAVGATTEMNGRTVTVSFKLSHEEAELLDRLRGEKSRSDFVRQLIVEPPVIRVPTEIPMRIPAPFTEGQPFVGTVNTGPEVHVHRNVYLPSGPPEADIAEGPGPYHQHRKASQPRESRGWHGHMQRRYGCTDLDCDWKSEWE